MGAPGQLVSIWRDFICLSKMVFLYRPNLSFRWGPNNGWPHYTNVHIFAGLSYSNEQATDSTNHITGSVKTHFVKAEGHLLMSFVGCKQKCKIVYRFGLAAWFTSKAKMYTQCKTKTTKNHNLWDIPCRQVAKWSHKPAFTVNEIFIVSRIARSSIHGKRKLPKQLTKDMM